jgi:hypothetical protein
VVKAQVTTRTKNAAAITFLMYGVLCILLTLMALASSVWRIIYDEIQPGRWLQPPTPLAIYRILKASIDGACVHYQSFITVCLAHMDGE